jgi:hypothetical protein
MHKPYQCHVCFKSYKTFESRRSHINQYHRENNNRVIVQSDDQSISQLPDIQE